MENNRSSKFTFNLNTSKDFLDQQIQPEDEHFETKPNHTKSKSRYLNIEEMKDETRKLFIKLEEKSYLENAEYKKEVSKQIKDMSDTIRNFQNFAVDLKNDVDKLNIRKTGSLGEAIEKIGKLEDEIITLRHKHNNNDKRVSDFIDKFEKIIDENLHLSGLVGEYNKFKDLKSILEYLLNSYQGSVVSKEKNALEYNIFKEKLEGKLSTLINKFELQEKSIKSLIYSRIDLVESNLRATIEQTNEKINEVRIENTKAAVRLISASELLEKEIKESSHQRSQLEKSVVNLCNDIKANSAEFAVHFQSSVNEIERISQEQKISDSELQEKICKSNAEVIKRNEKIEKYIESIEQRILEIKSSSVSKPYNYFFSSVNLSPEGFNLYFPRKNEENSDNTINHESSDKKTSRKVLFNVSSMSFHNKPYRNTENEENRRKFLSQSMTITQEAENILPNINLHSKSLENTANCVVDTETPTENWENPNNQFSLINFNEFRERVVENFQRSEYLVQDTRSKLIDLSNKINKLFNERKSSNFTGDLTNIRKPNANAFKTKMNNTDYHFNISSQAVFSSDEAEKERNKKITSKSTVELVIVKDRPSLSVRTPFINESKTSSNKEFIPIKTETNLNFTNTHLKKKLNISGGGSTRYKIQPDFGTIGNRMRELEIDEDLIDNNYSVKYMDPNSCNMPKVKITRHLAKPKDISGYMRFNIIDLKK